MIERIPRLDDWSINGEHLTAWINDVECFDVVPEGDGFALYINHTAQATSVYLGQFGHLAAAQNHARTYLGDDS